MPMQFRVMPMQLDITEAHEIEHHGHMIRDHAQAKQTQIKQ